MWPPRVTWHKWNGTTGGKCDAQDGTSALPPAAASAQQQLPGRATHTGLFMPARVSASRRRHLRRGGPRRARPNRVSTQERKRRGRLSEFRLRLGTRETLPGSLTAILQVRQPPGHAEGSPALHLHHLVGWDARNPALRRLCFAERKQTQRGQEPEGPQWACDGKRLKSWPSVYCSVIC